MSETNNDNTPDPRSGGGSGVHETGTLQARIRRTPWRGWVWSVPLAAIILVVYLIVRTWLLTGPTITITFPKAAGITSAGTPLQYKGVRVGDVKEVALTKDRQAVKVTVSVHSSVTGFLRSGTAFWVVHPSILSGDLADLISGPYITMLPGKGKKAHQFNGLLHPPATQPNRPGKMVTLYASSASGLSYGTPVLYHGLRAGEVLSRQYDASRDDVRVRVFVDKPFVTHLTGQTRFWRASGLNLSTGGSGVSFDVPPLDQLLNGAVAFATVQTGGSQAGHSRPDSHLYASEGAARNALTGRHVLFAASFPGSTAGIAPGSPVVLKGIRVGTVRSVSLHYDARHKRMVTPVTFDLYPKRFGIAHGKASGKPSPSAFEHILATLVSHGLRAQVSTANLVIGSKQISLFMATNPGKASLDTAAKPPRLPAVKASDISSVINRINTLPIQQIGDHVLHLTARAQKLISSPQVQQSLQHLNKVLANLQTVTGAAKQQLGPTLKSLRQVADATQSTADTINRVMGGSLGGQQNVQQLVGELTRAARSVRVLADYLQRHPEALIRGRDGQ